MNKFTIKPLTIFARAADLVLFPFMLLATGSFESPQKTHRWNNQRLSELEISSVDPQLMVHCPGIVHAKRMWFGKVPLFHLPIFGGWKEYAVLSVANSTQRWHAGWIFKDAAGISRIPLTGPARLLIGPSDMHFFAIDASTGEQILLTQIGSGKIGDNGVWRNLPLL